jgi:hypothetical protein
MNMPGYSADLSLYHTSDCYQSVGSSVHGRGLREVIPQFYNVGIGGIFHWCRGCLICDPWSHVCTCHYPCPVVAPPGAG